MQKTITTVLSLMAMCLPVRGGQVAADSEMPMTSGYTINLGVGLGNVVNLTPRPESSWLYAVVDCCARLSFPALRSAFLLPWR